MANSSHLPVLGKEIVSASVIFGDTVIVQDYPEQFISERPRRPHDSYGRAGSDFLFGIRTDNGSKSWTRIIKLKPSELVLDEWSKGMAKAGSGKIESLQCELYRGADLPSCMCVVAGYMFGIGKKVIGYISNSEFELMKKSAWEKQLGDSVLAE